MLANERLIGFNTWNIYVEELTIHRIDGHGHSVNVRYYKSYLNCDVKARTVLCSLAEGGCDFLQDVYMFIAKDPRGWY